MSIRSERASACEARERKHVGAGGGAKPPVKATMTTFARLRILFLAAALLPPPAPPVPLALPITAPAKAATEVTAAEEDPHRGGEANHVLPDLSTQTFQG